MDVGSPIEAAVKPQTRRGRPRRRIGAVTSIALLFAALMVLCVVGGSLLAPQQYNAIDAAVGATEPSVSHPLGTDALGRDILSRVIVGARPAILGALAVALGALAIGGTLGLLAGYFGGRTESVVMRWVDLMWILPAFLVVIVVAGILGGGYGLAILLLIVFSAPWDARVARSSALEQRPRAYVEAAKVADLGNARIIFRHILPNTAPVIMANTFLTFATALVSLAALSFLGLGGGPGSPEWGRMLSENRDILFENPWASIGPGAAIALTAASVSLLGDWLYELTDSRGKSR